MAVVTRPLGTAAQLVIVDTPGIHRPHRKLGEYMNAEARAAAEGADVVVMVVDASDGMAGPQPREPRARGPRRGDKPGLPGDQQGRPGEGRRRCCRSSRPTRRSARLSRHRPHLRGEGTTASTALLAAAGGAAARERRALPRRHPHRPAGAVLRRRAHPRGGDRRDPGRDPLRDRRGDRELRRAPRHAAHQRAAIHVERDGQKKILVGTGGERIKAIGARARAERRAAARPQGLPRAHREGDADWTRSPDALKRLGYERRPTESDA
jgi:GTP-binding protein Era